jgi:hypothetical protein
MDLVTLILMCTLAQSSTTNSMLYQIAHTTDGDPTYIDDLTDGVVYTPARIDDASKMVGALVSSGHDIRVGIMQLPAREMLMSYELEPAELVDSCRNVALASDRLDQARTRFPSSPPKALSWYMTGEPESALGLSWALDVLSVESVDLQEKLGDVENPLPSRKYTRPDSLIFVGEEKNTEGAASSSVTSRKFFLEKSRQTTTPEKWEPPSDAPKTSKARSAGSSSESSSAKSGAPQPPVTNERLKTSDELDTNELQEAK